MASGDTLACFFPGDNEPPTTNGAQPDVRNQHPMLKFDTATAWAAIFTGVMPRNYGGGGITVYVLWAAASATSGNVGWTVELERMNDGQDIVADSFGAVSTIAVATVPGAAGTLKVTNVAITNGTNMDNVAAGETFRLRIKRDVANDNAAGNAELYSVEVKET